MSTPNVAFILGCGYSGSTLLDLILGSHSRMISLGEIHAKAFDAFFSENKICTCLLKAHECYFWKNVHRQLNILTGQESFRLAPTGCSEDTIVHNTVNLYRAVKEVASSDLLIDSSKQLRRAHLLIESGLIQSKIIHLVRDGRGFAYSYVKRGRDFSRAVSRWKKTNAAILIWAEMSKAQNYLRIRYEDLCIQPIVMSRLICEFLGIDWDPEMLTFGQKTHHNIGGNNMRFTIKSSTILIDEAWKDNFGTDDLHLFEKLVGPFAHQLGY